MLLLVLIALCASASGELTGRWLANTWSAGNNWTDSISNVDAVPYGDPSLQTDAFGTCRDGIRINATAESFFIAMGTSLINHGDNVTIAVLFRSYNGSTTSDLQQTPLNEDTFLQSGVFSADVSGSSILGDFGMAIMGNGETRGWTGNAYQMSPDQGPDVTDDEIHTYIMTWENVDGRLAKWYIDGVKIGEANLGAIDADALGFGHTTNSSVDNYMNGILGEIRIYQQYFDDAGVAALSLALNKSALFELTTSVSQSNIDSIQTLTYTAFIENDFTTTLSGFFIDAPGLSGLSCDNIQPGESLGPLENVTCTATYQVTQEDLNAGTDLVFNFSVSFCDDNVGDFQEMTTSITQFHTFTVVKTGAAEIDNPGDVNNYTVTIVNTGNVDLLDINVTDVLVDLMCENSDTSATLSPMAPGATIVCTGSYVVTQDDFNFMAEVNNTVSVEFSNALAAPVEASYSTTLNRVISFSVEKLNTPNETDLVGMVIAYNISIFNTGNVELTDFNYTDAFLDGNLTCVRVNLTDGEVSSEPYGMADVGDNLLFAQGFICSGEYTTTQDDFNTRDQIINQVFVTFVTADGIDVAANDTAVTRLIRIFSFEAIKTGDKSVTQTCNDIIYYNVTIVNTGNTDLEGFAFEDSLVNNVFDCDVEQGATLFNSGPDGDVITCTMNYTVTAEDFNSNDRVANVARISFTTENLEDAASFVTRTINVIRPPQNHTGPWCEYGEWLASNAYACTACGATNIKTFEYCEQPAGSPKKWGVTVATAGENGRPIGTATFTLSDGDTCTCDAPPACPVLTK